MSEFAILDITDGTDTVSLLSPTLGFHLDSWTPALSEPKGGGVWQDSPLAELRRNVQSVLATSNEVFDLKINGTGQDSLIVIIQDFLRLLLLGRDYWNTKWQNTIVYLQARAKCETNIRYAELRGFTIAELANPYAQPFYSATLIAAMDNITLGIERGHWLANIPGNGVSTVADGKQSWRFNDKWAMYEDLGPVPDLPLPADSYSAVQAVGDATIIIGGNDSGGGDEIYVSTDQASTWAASTGGGATSIYDFLKIADNYILASDDNNADRILLTTDEGVSFSVLSSTVGGGPLLRLLNGNILTGYSGDDVYQSTDDGATWSLLSTIGTSGTIKALKQSPTTGTIIATVQFASPAVPPDQLYRSVDNGVTWSLAFSPGSAENLSGDDTGPQIMDVDSDGIFYHVIYAGTQRLLKSIDDGFTWAQLDPGISTSVYLVFVDSSDNLYIADDTGGGGDIKVYRSIDGGVTIFEEFSGGGEFFPRDMTESDDGDYYIPGTGIGGAFGGLVFSINDAQDFGGSSDDRIEIANKQNVAQLSHIFIDDGTVFGSNLFPVAAAFDLFPAVPVVNDAIYFGISTALIDSGPFASLRFNIIVPISISGAGAAATIVWEYYNGAFVTLTVQDNTGIVDPFDQIGINSVHWEQPSDAIAVSVNGVTAFWVRARISALTGTLTPPEQANEDIFTIITPFAEIADTGVLGDLPAQLRERVVNRSDADGRSGSAPDLWDNRIIVGLRSFSRGSTFQAYLNASDEQNPIGITVSLGTNTTFATDITTPTGRRAIYNPAGVEAEANRVTWALGPDIARDFYGTFHIFARVRRVAGLVTDFTIKFRVATGTGGVAIDTAPVQVQTSTAFELLDFGQVEIPASDILQPTELADNTNLSIRASAASGTPDLYIYDLILIPVDEWAGDSTDGRNSNDSIVGLDDNDPKFLDIDSLTFPKRSLRSMVRIDGTDLITAIYRAEANGPAILQANEQQRLWFLAAQTSATGTSFDWIAPPEIAHSLELFHNARYLGFRGNR